MADYLNYNGKFIKSDKAIITADNRSFRYGDGLFETMKLHNGKIQLAEYHFERLWEGIKFLEFNKPKFLTFQYFADEILSTFKKNNHTKNARIRITVFRGKGGLYDPENHFPNYIIQTFNLQPANNGFNNKGFIIDVYPHARKAIDRFSHLKTNNYLPYVMAALYAKKKHLNDCLLLNSKGAICDATIANVFIIKNDKILTPSLSEGCVKGVMRRFLLENLHTLGFKIEERSLNVGDLIKADEVFLSNAIYGIRWVRQYSGVKYNYSQTLHIYNSLIRNIR